MSSAAITADSDLQLLAGTPSLDDDLYREIKSQLERKLMTYIPGIPMNPALAVDLYANSIQGFGRIHAANVRMDGGPNNNPSNFGNVYEEQEVTAFNREQILSGSSLRAERTDNLADNRWTDADRGNLHDYAIKHHEHADMVAFDDKTGNVTKTYQIKHTRGSNILARDAYTSHEEAPDAILTPPDMTQRHGEKLDAISRKAHSAENRENAALAADKLESGKVDSKWTGNPDKDNHPGLHQVVQDHPEAGKAIPYLHQGAVMGRDALVRVGGRLALDGAAVLMGGCLFEIRDAYQNPGRLSFLERLKRLFSVLFSRMKEMIKEKGPMELCTEAATALLGLLSGMFRNLKTLFKTLAQGIQQLAPEIWAFITGKTESFADFSAKCMKILSALAVTSCAIAAEQYLTVTFPWMPGIVAGLASAAIAGIAIVFINRGIDHAIGTIATVFSEAKAAKIHRERVEAYISETLSGLLENSERINASFSKYLENREKIHNLTYNQLCSSFYEDPEKIRQILNRHAAAMGVEQIGDDYLDDLEKELMDFAKQKHG